MCFSTQIKLAFILAALIQVHLNYSSKENFKKRNKRLMKTFKKE